MGSRNLVNMIAETGEAYGSPVSALDDIVPLLEVLQAHQQFQTALKLEEYYERMNFFIDGEFDLSINVKERYATDA